VNRRRRIFLFACAALTVSFGSLAWPKEVPEVRVLSRDAESIEVAATNFKTKSEKLVFYRIRFSGTELIEKTQLPDDAFRISTQDFGVHELTIFVEKTNPLAKGDKERVLWKQDLYAVPYSKALADPEVRARLAHELAPVALFHREEEYYPSSIPYVLNEDDPDPQLAKETYHLKLRDGVRTSSAYTDIAHMLATHGDSKAVLNTTRFKEVMGIGDDQVTKSRLRFRTGTPEGATLYYSVLEDLGMEMAYFNYHFLYAFDPKNGTSEKPAKAGHAFDRESLTVIVDTRSMKPEAVVFGAHLPNQTMGYFSDVGESIFRWKGGRVKIPWGEVDKIGEHPIAAVAKGSHGIYPIPGYYAVVGGGAKLLKESVGGNRVLIPPRLVADLEGLSDSRIVDLVTYRLTDLGLDEATSSSWNRILVFSGDVVDVLGTSNAKFPPFTPREMNPTSYGRNAETWPVDRIPTSARDHVDLLVEFLNRAAERGHETP
jgi:hypothetical protein